VTPVMPTVADFEKVLSADVVAALGTTTTIAYTAPVASTSDPSDRCIWCYGFPCYHGFHG